jgi:hypothetical protein
MQTETPTTLCRYQSNHIKWYLNTYGPATYVHTADGKLGTEPDWLKTVMNVARAGGNLVCMPDGNTMLMWFYVDKDKQLVRFKL